MGRRSYQAPRFAAHLIIPLLMAAAALWIRFAPPAQPAEAPRLNVRLPAALGDFACSLVLHCQNENCRMAFPVKAETDMTTCTACGGALLPLTRSERDVLPADTRIVRRTYKAPGSPFYTVTIVLAGADPRSIHRPQQCLPAQGFSIDRQSDLRLAAGPSRTLDTMRIDARQGPDPRSRFAFIYWFVGAGRLTASHAVRMLWTLYDQLLLNRTARWAYVAVTISEPLDTPQSQQRLEAFVQLLLPALETQPPEAP